MDNMKWRAGSKGGALSADCEVSHRNQSHMSNSEREIEGRCADKMPWSRSFCDYDFLLHRVLASQGHLTSLGSVNFF